ncbi:hypothetical protein T492DRAFT_1124562 [Pavlovales sp. CCMP2436]|nr:hypothetical protein T492DRAFT_1124562 [Pavlovales sp. CCMP2436]
MRQTRAVAWRLAGPAAGAQKGSADAAAAGFVQMSAAAGGSARWRLEGDEEEEEDDDDDDSEPRTKKVREGTKQADIDLLRASAQIFFGITPEGKLQCGYTDYPSRAVHALRWLAGRADASNEDGAVMARGAGFVLSLRNLKQAKISHEKFCEISLRKELAVKFRSKISLRKE